MPAKRAKVLVIYHKPPHDQRVTVDHHLRALDYCEERFDFTYYNAHDAVPDWTKVDETRGPAPAGLSGIHFHAVLLHYSFLSQRNMGLPFYHWKRKFEWINDFSCLKIAIPQDEGDYAGTLDDWLFEMDVSVIFSVHYSPYGPLYPIMRNHGTFYPCLPGYVDEGTTAKYSSILQPLAQRNLDLVYRARRLPLWYGTAGRLKYAIGDVFKERASSRGLNIDISTNYKDAIFGDAWFDFIASSKAVIGTQGGYSVIDWRGEIKAGIQRLIEENPGITPEEVAATMPDDWDRYRLFTVTPRHFEAAMLKTAQVLVQGEYKGILHPHEHYIPVAEDLSNVDDAVEQLRDVTKLQRMADRVYDDIARSGRYSYRVFARNIADAIDNHCSGHQAFPGVVSSTAAFRKDEAIQNLERQLVMERQRSAALLHKLDGLKDRIPEIVHNAVGDASASVVEQGVRRAVKVNLGASVKEAAQDLYDSFASKYFCTPRFFFLLALLAACAAMVLAGLSIGFSLAALSG